MTTEKATAISTLNGHSRCLLCGDLNPRSLRLRFEVGEDGVVRTTFKAQADLQGYDDILHGGVIAALLDSAMTHCLFHQGVQAVTGDLRIRYLQPVQCSASLDIQAWLLSSHPPLYRLRAEILAGQQIMAWAEARFMQRDHSSDRPHL